MSGSLRFCCTTLDNLKSNKGNRLHVNNDSLYKAWNCNDIKEARLKMMRGETVSACKKCNEQEARGYKSMRRAVNMETNFANTNADGSVNVKPIAMELHFGNLCNLKCKMCGQQYSNQIGKELLEIGKEDSTFIDWITKESGNVNIWTNNLSVEYKWFQNYKVMNKLFEYIAKHIEKLVVIGGEPTVIPEFWELFSYLDERGKLDKMDITLTTNLTTINPKMTDWLPKLKKWTIWASVDGVGARTEYIRYPSNFQKVCKNLEFYKNLLRENDTIVLSPAIQLLNIDHLDDILKWWIQFSDGSPDAGQFGVSWLAQVWYPTICNYDILPSKYKKSVAEKLERSLDVFQPYKDIARYYETQIENLRKDVYTEQQKAHFQRAFIRYNDTQDQHRKNKTWRSLLPDLESALTKSLS